MWYEIEPNQFVIRLYDDEKHPDTYYASAIIRTYGDVALVSSISSPRFIEWAIDNLEVLFKETNTTSLQGYMSKVMARACRMISNGKAKYEETSQGNCANKPMPWIKISKQENI